MENTRWYEAENLELYDSPAILVSPDLIRHNIRKLLEHIPAGRLRPHVKSNKTAEICQLMMEAGIRKFKTATIAETEMLARIHAPDVLLAYPPTDVKTQRLIQLIRQYPETHFSFLLDAIEPALTVSDAFTDTAVTGNVYIDLNTGMNRTGILPEKAFEFYQQLSTLPSLHVAGLHAYDGHIKDQDPNIRKANCLMAIASVLDLKKNIEAEAGRPLTLVAGGTPTCFIHAEAGNRECSPGTFIFWDQGYANHFPEQPFTIAAVLITRVISIISEKQICIDLGYKSVASEDPLPRVHLLNVRQAIPQTHSEEHMVLQVEDTKGFHVGDVLFGVPTHICPTVALYDELLPVENHQVSGVWKVIAGKRKISI